MHEERVEIEGVPTRLYEPEGATSLVLLGHGGGHSKDEPRFLRLAREYAAGTGRAVVCIDAVDHGERRPRGTPPPGIPARWHSSTTPRMVADWQGVAAALAGIGPVTAYVGFSMGALFGLSVVAAMPEITSAVFVAGGLPSGWVDDPPLRRLLLATAREVTEQWVLMINNSDDELFPASEVNALFDAIATSHKRLLFWPGPHDDWPRDAIQASIDFINDHG